MKLLKGLLFICLMTAPLMSQDGIGLYTCPTEFSFAEGTQDRCFRRSIEFRDDHASISMYWEITDEDTEWYTIENRSGYLTPGESDHVRVWVHRENMADSSIYYGKFNVHAWGLNYDYTREIKFLATKNVRFSVDGIRDASAKRNALTIDFSMGVWQMHRYVIPENFTITPELALHEVTWMDSSLQFITDRHQKNVPYTLVAEYLVDELHRLVQHFSIEYVYADTGLVLKNFTIQKMNEPGNELCDSSAPPSFHTLGYPNPFTNELHVHVNSPYQQKVNVQLVNILGQVVLNRDINAMTGFNMLHFDIDQNYPSGAYFLRVVTREKTFSKKMFRVK